MKIHALLLFLLLPVSLWAESFPSPIVSFDMPHGGCRLMVNSDGSGVLSYGALPTQIRVKPGILQPSVLVGKLRGAAIPQFEGERPPRYGSVKFGVSEELFWFDDRELARANIRKALSGVEVPGPMSRVGASFVERVCHEV